MRPGLGFFLRKKSTENFFLFFFIIHHAIQLRLDLLKYSSCKVLSKSQRARHIQYQHGFTPSFFSFIQLKTWKAEKLRETKPIYLLIHWISWWEKCPKKACPPDYILQMHTVLLRSTSWIGPADVQTEADLSKGLGCVLTAVHGHK